jgi:hypothetical protein
MGTVTSIRSIPNTVTGEHHEKDRDLFTLFFRTMRDRPYLLLTGGILLFVGANTCSLIYEQSKGLISLGYNETEALLLGSLNELGIELLACIFGLMAFSYREAFWKVATGMVLAGTVFIAWDTLKINITGKAMDQIHKPVSLVLAETQAKNMSKQFADAQISIAGLKSSREKVYATIQLDKKGGLSEKVSQALANLREEEKAFKVSDVFVSGTKRADVLAWSVQMRLLWNIFLMAFIGYFWRNRAITSRTIAGDSV